MQLTMEKNNLDWVDAYKGVLILLVVLWHALGQAISYYGIESHKVLAEINRREICMEGSREVRKVC